MNGAGLIIFILIIMFAIAAAMFANSRHEESIRQKVESFGGSVISIEKTMFNNGPFFIKGKGRTIYRFEYKMGNETKEGWVKFGSIFGADWRV